MSNELVHATVGTTMTQSEFEAVGLHVLNSQATGDLIYASSAAQLTRLGIGATNTVLTVIGGVPTWQSTLAGLTLTAPIINACTLGGTVTGAAQILSNLGTVYIGDTSNTNMTLGLTINQGAADDNILSLKSSDVGHPMTIVAETDTYARFGKSEATSGGLCIIGLKDADGQGAYAVWIRGCLSQAADTTKSTLAGGSIVLTAAITDGGTSITAVGANGNLVTIENSGTARFIFDAEGSGHADVEWTTYAEHDDLAIIGDMETELILKEDKSKTERRHALEAVGIIGKDSWHMENGKPKAMVNMTKLSMLHHGALLQLHERIDILEKKLLGVANG